MDGFSVNHLEGRWTYRRHIGIAGSASQSLG